ncbi:MAG: gliding motility-associated C-terminal domain-containing protein [Flavobacteriales bacterium]
MVASVRSLSAIVALGLLALDLSGQDAMRFIENKGQWPVGVTHRAELPGATVWCERGALVIDRYDAEALVGIHGNIAATPPDSLRHHAVRLRFISAVTDTRSEASREVSGRYNYFIGNDPAHWAHNARAFAAVTMKNIAPGCDAIFQEGRAGLKYDLVLAPGADAAMIQFTYEGADRLSLREGALIVATSLGRLVERIPLAYQDIDGIRSTIACRYTLKNGIVGVQPGAYDKTRSLVIDPTLSFATYSGSVSNNFGCTATFDNVGFLYAGSTAFGAQFPVTTGAYQTVWAGGATDIAITKYDTTGTFLVWSTYLGGSAAEMPHSLVVGSNDQLVVLGTTGSANFPITTGAHDNSFGGGGPFTPSGLGLSYPAGCDMIVARLSADGSALLGSTYLGGSANDGLNSAPALKFNYADEVRGEVLLDALGRVWVASCTQSTNMPVTAGAAQLTAGGGSHDGFVARYDPLLTQLQYGSYLGGTGADAVYSAEIDAQGQLYVCGGTTSTDLPVSGTAFDGTFNGGQSDAFAARFSSNGSTVDALTYWGSANYDQAYFVELDQEGNVFLFGQTNAPGGELIQNVIYNIPLGGQFITKFDPELSNLLLGSRTGSGDGTPDISPTAFLVDVCDKIYTSGWGSSAGGLGGALTTAGLPVTPGAIQTTTDGHDLYLAVFDIDMDALYYATYYGGGVSPEHVDGGTSRFDRRGRVYQSVCAGCQGNSDFPTTPGAWSATNNSGGCNNGVLKLDFDAPLVIAAFTAPDTICGSGAIAFTNLSGGASGYIWDFGDQTGSTLPSPSHGYGAPGTYTVTLTALNPNACNEQDIAVRTIVVEPAAPDLQVMNDTLICGPVASLTLIATSSAPINFIWSTSDLFTDTLNSSLTGTTIISPAVSGTYYVLGDNGSYCKARDSVYVIVSLASPSLLGDELICGGDTATLQLLGGDPGSSIVWSPVEEILTGQGTATATVSPDEQTTYGVSVTAPSGCTWSGTLAVSVSPIFGSSVGASVDQTLVLPGTTVHFQATPASGVTYSWAPSDLLSDPTIANPTAVITQTTTFIVTVSDGICTRSTSVVVKVYEMRCDAPDIFVPNTFTPNGDGNNDVLFVRGHAIKDLEFLVFDRWGEKVFETTDQTLGWDGSYKGKPVDPAVFVYHLTAYCIDGQRYFTKGNVTVIR